MRRGLSVSWSQGEKLSTVPLKEQAGGGKKLLASGLLREAQISVLSEVLYKLHPCPPPASSLSLAHH